MTRPYELLALLVLLSCGPQSAVQGWQHKAAENLVTRVVTICVAGHRYGAVVGGQDTVFPLFTPGGAPQRCAEQ